MYVWIACQEKTPHTPAHILIISPTSHSRIPHKLQRPSCTPNTYCSLMIRIRYLTCTRTRTPSHSWQRRRNSLFKDLQPTTRLLFPTLSKVSRPTNSHVLRVPELYGHCLCVSLFLHLRTHSHAHTYTHRQRGRLYLSPTWSSRYRQDIDC